MADRPRGACQKGFGSQGACGAVRQGGKGRGRGEEKRRGVNWTGERTSMESRVRIHFSQRRFGLLSGSFCFVAGNNGNCCQAIAINIFMQCEVNMVTDIGAVRSYLGLSMPLARTKPGG